MVYFNFDYLFNLFFIIIEVEYFIIRKGFYFVLK